MGLSLYLFKLFWLVFLAFCFSTVCCGPVFDVAKFGAVGNGKTENTNAFQNAWKEACQAGGSVLVGDGTYLVNPIAFEGPCNQPVTFMVNGVVLAPPGRPTSQAWVSFKHISGLFIRGSGTFDGNGLSVYNSPKCKPDPTSCTTVALSLSVVNQSSIQDITLKNSKGFHMKLAYGHDITVNNIHITAPGDSTNTDGIHMGVIDKVSILNSNIGVGDDCVSIGPGSTNVNVTGVNCGPGHGISLGSIGGSPSDAPIQGVHVQHCTLSSTQNGARIKTWMKDYTSSVSDVTFEDIQMDNTQNPIVIDQKYCFGQCSKSSHVQVSDVNFIGIRGTSSTKVAVKLDCSKTKPCRDIKLSNINLSLSGGGKAESLCSNADVTYSGTQNPPPACKKHSS